MKEVLLMAIVLLIVVIIVAKIINRSTNKKLYELDQLDNKNEKSDVWVQNCTASHNTKNNVTEHRQHTNVRTESIRPVYLENPIEIIDINPIIVEDLCCDDSNSELQVPNNDVCLESHGHSHITGPAYESNFTESHGHSHVTESTCESNFTESHSHVSEPVYDSTPSYGDSSSSYSDSSSFDSCSCD